MLFDKKYLRYLEGGTSYLDQVQYDAVKMDLREGYQKRASRLSKRIETDSSFALMNTLSRTPQLS